MQGLVSRLPKRQPIESAQGQDTPSMLKQAADSGHALGCQGISEVGKCLYRRPGAIQLPITPWLKSAA